jgi:hypothetical protein
VEAQRLDDLGVAEVEHVAAAVDDGDLGAQRREHRGELDADHPGTHDEQRPGDAVEPEHDVVGVENRLAVELDVGRARRLGAGRDQDRLCGQPPFRARAVLDDDGVRVGEARAAVVERDVVAEQLVADDAPLALDDLTGAHGEVVDLDLVLEPVVLAVDPALGKPGQVDDGLPDRLGRNGARVDRDAAEVPAALDERDALVHLRRLDGRLLARGARPDDEEVDVVCHLSLPVVAGAGR